MVFVLNVNIKHVIDFTLGGRIDGSLTPTTSIIKTALSEGSNWNKSNVISQRIGIDDEKLIKVDVRF